MASSSASAFERRKWRANAWLSCSYPARSSRLAVIAQAAQTGTIVALAFFNTSMNPPISVSLPS